MSAFYSAKPRTESASSDGLILSGEGCPKPVQRRELTNRIILLFVPKWTPDKMNGMSLKISRTFSDRSSRVKSVDLHPSEPWMLVSLYDGHLVVYNYQTGQKVKEWEVSGGTPVRCAAFIPRKQWVICGADDHHIHVFNLNTGEVVKRFQAHTDYIRALDVHPTLPLVITSSDDSSIKLWDWDKDWSLTRIYDGHTYYVMSLAFNPKDPNTFASASLDKTVIVWGLTSSKPHFTLEGRDGHSKGVNTVAYYPGGDKPYLVSAGDDMKVKIWDYVNRSCVMTLDGHNKNISAAGEDGQLLIWNSKTYRLEKTLNYGWGRVWSLAVRADSNHLAVGYEEGPMVLKLGREVPAASMEQTGKIIYAKHTEIILAQVRANFTEEGEWDGTDLPLALKELGSSEVYPQSLLHSPNGRLCAVVGDGEYTIYAAVGWRNKAFGSALEFVWGRGKGQYAVREQHSKVTICKDFKEALQFRPDFTPEGIFGGPLLGVRSNDFLCFYDWESGKFIKQIDVNARQLYWSENGSRLVIASDTAFYELAYNADVVANALATNSFTVDGDVDGAFPGEEIEVAEKVRSGTWVGDCFIYVNSKNKLNYSVGGRVETIAHLDKTKFLLGYMPRHSRVFLMDKSFAVVSYLLHLDTINYQTAVLRKDFQAAQQLLPKIPEGDRTRIAHFLEAQGYAKQALKVSLDPDHRFELAVQLGDLVAAEAIIMEEAANDESAGSEHKWKQLSDLALATWNFELAETALWKANDLNGLLLLFSSLANADGVERVYEAAKKEGKNNLCLLCLIQLGRTQGVLDLLLHSGRDTEAALFARSYLPSQLPQALDAWRTNLSKTNAAIADSLADPEAFPNLFPTYADSLLVEKSALSRNSFSTIDELPPASEYPTACPSMDDKLLELLSAQPAGSPPSSPSPPQVKKEESAPHEVDLLHTEVSSEAEDANEADDASDGDQPESLI